MYTVAIKPYRPGQRPEAQHFIPGEWATERGARAAGARFENMLRRHTGDTYSLSITVWCKGFIVWGEIT